MAITISFAVAKTGLVLRHRAIQIQQDVVRNVGVGIFVNGNCGCGVRTVDNANPILQPRLPECVADAVGDVNKFVALASGDLKGGHVWPNALETAGSLADSYNYCMENAAEVAIIGGGVIGLTTAYFLAREGRRTTVFDKGDLGQEASWAGAGILPACDLARARTPLERLRGHSCALFPTLSSELLQFTRIDNGYRQCGGLEFLDVPGRIDDDEWNADPGAAGPLSGRQLSELEPSVASNLGRAVHLPGMAQVRNPWHLRALIAACEKLAVNLRRHCPTTALERAGNRISAVRTPQGHVEVGSVLVAAGAWSEDLLAIVGWKPGIKPIRGQIVLLKAPAVPLQHILLWGSRYIVPRGDGHILVGSTEEDAGFEKRNTAVAVQELLELACRLVPDLAGATIERCWSGLRPGSPDGSPFLGRVPGLANLFVAAGHFRAGIVLSPGTALVMKELLLGQKTTVPLDAFRLDRPQKC